MSGALGKVRGAGRRIWSALAVAGLLSAVPAGARAQDVGSFFNQLFGGGDRAAAPPLPQPDYGVPDSPPLTVRARKHRRPTGDKYARRASPRYTAEELKGVTIYTDRTLVRGDAVMTRAGLRIFNGAQSDAHAEGDFVAISSADKLPKTVRKELTAIDVAARSDFRAN